MERADPRPLEPHASPARIGELAAIGLLLGLWAYLRRAAPLTVDLSLFDETSYLMSGWRLLREGTLPRVEQGPLYGAWYALWQLLAPDAVDRFFAQWLATDLLVGLGVYAVLRRAARGPAPALGATALYWLLPVSTWMVPRVGIFALGLVLIAALLERRSRWSPGAGLALASLARPDYVAGLGLWLSLEAWRVVRPAWRRRVAAGLATLALAGTIAAPLGWLGPVGGGRVWMAFSQHHALHFAEAHPERELNSWLEHERITAEVFPGCTSLSEALRVNPGALARHLATNAAWLPAAVAGGIHGRGARWVDLLVAASLLVTAGFALRHRRELPRTIACALAVALPALVVFPKPMYVLPLTLAALYGGVKVASALAGRAERTWPALAQRSGAATATSFALVVAAAGVLAPNPDEAHPQDYLTVVRQLRPVWASLGLDTTWRLLQSDGDYCAYLDPARCTTVPSTRRSEDTFRGIVMGRDVNAIVVSAGFESQESWRGDDDFRRFLLQPEAFGFVREPRVRFVALYLRR